MLVLLALTALTPAQDPVREPAPWPSEEWPTAAPADVGLDPKPLDELARLIRTGKIKNTHSLLVVRHGYLVFEEYFDGHTADELHMLQSVSKSFTSALVGIAIEQGKIEGVDERVLGFFPELEGIENVDERKRAMSLEDLLTMRSGTDYHERGSSSPHSKLNRLNTGWTEFILSRPMIRQPGSEFQYDSGAVILVSAILAERTGLHGHEFAERHLFAPLGIERYEWYKNDDNHAHMGGGLDLRSRDVARFGLLYLRDGVWKDEQLIPADWVASSLSRKVEFGSNRNRSEGYGYWWWVFSPDPQGSGKQDIYAACGFRGQYIFLVPEHDLLVVVTSGGRGWAEEKAPRDFLYTRILPSVHG